MKILLINNFHYRFGGASAAYLNTAQLLKNAGHEVVFFSILDPNNIESQSSEYFLDRKIEVNSNGLKNMFNLFSYFYNTQAAKNIKSLIKQKKPDIAHIHLFYGGITSSILPVLRKYKVPIIHTVHDYRIICPAYTFLDNHGNICESCKGNKFFQCAIKMCNKSRFLPSMIMSLEVYYRNFFFNPIKYLNGILYPSNFIKLKHIEHNKKIEKIKSITLHNFNLEQFNKTTIASKYFLFYGRISREKGLRTLISAFKNLPSYNLKIVGEGTLLNELKNETYTSGLTNVDFLGHKSGEQLFDLISNAYFVLVPSEWYENNPMTIIESYSYGIPVIGSNVGGISELITNNVTGFTFNPKDVNDLVKVIKDVSCISDIKYLELSRNATDFAARNFSDKIHYARLLQFYKEVIHDYKQ